MEKTDNLMTEAQQACETSCFLNRKETTENVNLVLIDRHRDRRVVLKRERPEAVECLFIIAGTPGRQGSVLRWVLVQGGGEGTLALSCLVLLWSRVLAAGVIGSSGDETGALCVWQCGDTWCLAALRIQGRLLQFLSVSLVGPDANFWSGGVGRGQVAAVLYGTLRPVRVFLMFFDRYCIC
jgi:hypothetical protein